MRLFPMAKLDFPVFKNLFIVLLGFVVLSCGQSGSSNLDSANSSIGTNNGANPSQGSNPSDSPSTPGSGSPNLTIVEQVISLTNQYRSQNGLPPLTYNAQLTQAAQNFAVQMGTLNFFSHTSPDGTDPGDRIVLAGYKPRTWGENIAYGYSTPAQVMTGWMNSSGHKANILNTSFKEIGVGYYVVNSTAYWVQNFGAQ